MTNEEVRQALGECKGKLQFYIELADSREKRIHELIRKNVDLELEIEDLKWEQENA